MKRVCIFCEKWGSGGIETFILNVLQYVDKQQFEIHLFAVQLESEAYLPRLQQLGLLLTVFPPSFVNSHIRFHTFYNLIKDTSYDVAYFNLYEGLSLGYVSAAKRAGVPVRIVHSHNAGLRKSFFRFAKLALHNLTKKCCGKDVTCWLACSQIAGIFMFPPEVISSGQWTLIPNGIQEKQFVFSNTGRVQMRQELCVGDALLIGCIGRLCYQKNQQFLLRVFQKICTSGTNSRLCLVGEGEDLELLHQQADQLGINDSVIFWGVTDRIPELLWAFDVLVVPSIFEGLGIVAIEAQAAGLPVICSDKVPPEVKITHLAQFLSLDNTEDQWVERLLNCYEDTRQDTSALIAAAGYSTELVSKKMQEIWS